MNALQRRLDDTGVSRAGGSGKRRAGLGRIA